MSSNLEDTQANLVRYYGLQRGVVTSIADPVGLHRVQAIIPGLIEPNTDWLYPLTLGGGSPQRGGHVVPAVGSDVAVWFHNGDPHGTGHYAASNWGVPASTGSEMPGDAKDAGNANPEQVQSLQIGTLRVTVDERPGKRELQVLDVDPTSGDAVMAIVMDLEKRAIQIQAVSALVLKAVGVVHIDGLEVVINGRRVAPGPSQI